MFKGGKRVLNPLQNNFFGIMSVWEYYKLLHLKIMEPEKVYPDTAATCSLKILL